MPTLDSTILATATAWRAAPISILRLSGPEAFSLVESIGGPPANPPPRAHFVDARIRVAIPTGTSFEMPATVYRFPAPRSYTGQHVAELHTIGCLPALRALSADLLTRGARRALPGEFTARAFLAGKLDASQVGGVLSLIHARDAAAARNAARIAGGAQRALIEQLLKRLDELLALIEAGIDFVEEEGVQFVTAAQLRAALDELCEWIRDAMRFETASIRANVPHVALVGLPNAGKSTLFNALLGYERAIVSPVAGTTRDVLSAQLDFAGITFVLQDCAGLGHTPDEIELAAHNAAERTADLADLLLWVHDIGAPWSPAEVSACARIPSSWCVLVLSKIDRDGVMSPPQAAPPISFDEVVRVSAATRAGLSDLSDAIRCRISAAGGAMDFSDSAEQLQLAVAALGRATLLTDSESEIVQHPELIAVELRLAAEALGRTSGTSHTEDILGLIFGQFCIGK